MAETCLTNPAVVEETIEGVHVEEPGLAFPAEVEETIVGMHVEEPCFTDLAEVEETVVGMHVEEACFTILSNVEETVEVRIAPESDSLHHNLAIIPYVGPLSVRSQYKNPNDCIYALEPMTWRFAIDTTFFGYNRSRTHYSTNYNYFIGMELKSVGF